MRLGYSPMGCRVPRLGLETSNPCARALDSAISTRLDSTGLGLNWQESQRLILGVVGKARRWVLWTRQLGNKWIKSLVEARKRKE